MQPALSTLPNSGLPLVRKPVEDQLVRAAGFMIVTPNGEALFLRYAPGHDHAGEWAWPAGGLEGDEEARDAAIRETREETGWIPNEEIKEVDSSQDEVDFTTFATTSNNQFIPELSSEHDSWCWAPLSNPPEPLHPGVRQLLDTMAADQKPIAQAHSGAANIASRSELNSIGLPKTQPQSRAINIAFKNGGTTGPEAKQSHETNRFIDSGGLTEHDRERTGKSKAVLGKDEVKKEASRGRFFDEKPAQDSSKSEKLAFYREALKEGKISLQEYRGFEEAIHNEFMTEAEKRQNQRSYANPSPAVLELKNRGKAKDAEYVEKPHIGRLPPREAERLSRDSELTEGQRAWARKKLGVTASEEEMRKAVEEAMKDRLNYTSAGAKRGAKDDKETKRDANYIDGPVDTEPCKACSMFQSPRGCSAVIGDISPTGHCDLFEAATAEDALRDEDEEAMTPSQMKASVEFQKSLLRKGQITKAEFDAVMAAFAKIPIKGAKDAEDYRSERGFVAKLTDEKGSTIETSPLMISRNSAQKWLDEKSAKLKRLGRAVQGTIRESFMDPAYINADAADAKFNLHAARRKFREGKSKNDFRSILNQGENAARTGKSLGDNPYPHDDEDYETWKEGFEDYQKEFGKPAGDAIAFDEGSVRTTDPDGRLHVATTNISKAVVNPYKGSEIPDYEKLGLEPDKIYQLYRDPDELAKAAPTFNNLPLLKQHVPITADTHKPELVLGSTGTDASFEYPYLKNSLVLWSKDGIDNVKSGKKKELSSAYRYTADMTPGVWEDPETGERKNYDGIMRSLIGNHVALVSEGRAGHDVVVGDSKAGLVSRKRKRRAMGTISKTAANTALVLSAYIRPKLAQDQKVNLLPVVEGLTAKNFDERRSRIIREVRKLTKGKLANDASIGEIAEVLDLLEAHPDTGEDAPVTDVQEAMMSEMTDVPGASNVSGQGSPGGDRRGARDRRARDTSYDRRARDRRARDNFPPQDREDDMEQEGEDRRARDADPTAAVEAFLKDKVSGSDLQHVCNLMRGGGEDDSPGNDSEPHAEGEEQLEELGASHGAEDDPPRPEISDIERSREWHVGEGEPPPGGGGHPGKTIQDRHARDRRAQDRRGARDRKRAHDEPPPFKGMPKPGEGPMDKRAMDQAIKVSVEQAIKNQQLIRQAERDVRPWVGELAMDSATCPEDVYAAALKARNIKTEGIHPSAYSVILKNLPLPGQQVGRGSSPRVAMDAASRASFSERFPSVGRIGLL